MISSRPSRVSATKAHFKSGRTRRMRLTKGQGELSSHRERTKAMSKWTARSNSMAWKALSVAQMLMRRVRHCSGVTGQPAARTANFARVLFDGAR